jgi:hypothetical protein
MYENRILFYMLTYGSFYFSVSQNGLKYWYHIVTDHYFPASFPNIMSYYRIIMSRTYYQFWIKSDLYSVLL